MARVAIDDRFMTQLQALLQTDSPAKVTDEALTLLNWAIGEVQAGRTIFSADAEARDVRKLALPFLVKLQPNGAKA